MIDRVDQKPSLRIVGDIPRPHRLDNSFIPTQQQPAALVRRRAARVTNQIRNGFRSYF